MSIIILIPALACIIALFRDSTTKAFLNIYLPVFFLLPIYYFWKIAELPPIDFAEAALLPLGLAILIKDLRHWRPTLMDLSLALFILSSCYADYLAERQTAFIFNLFSTLVTALIPYMIGKLLIEQHRARIATVKRIVVLLAINCVISAYEYRMGQNPFALMFRRFFPGETFAWKTQIRWGFGRVSGPFGQSELAGIILIFGLVLALWAGYYHLWPQRFRYFRRWPLSPAATFAALIALTLLMTQARGPWIGAVVAIPIAFIGRSKRVLRTAVITILCLTIGIAGIYIGLNRYASGPVTSEEQETAQYRQHLLTNYIPVAKAGGPWGWGQDFPRVGGQGSIDNQFLFVALVQGWVGLLAFCLIAVEAILHMAASVLLATGKIRPPLRLVHAWHHARTSRHQPECLPWPADLPALLPSCRMVAGAAHASQSRQRTRLRGRLHMMSDRTIGWRPSIRGLYANGWGRLLFTLAILLFAQPLLAQTTITITSKPLRTNVQRFGINLSGQTYYDSGQLLRNLISRNPGFEGETWQSILHCKSATATTCIDENPWTVWPANFLAHAHYEVLSGAAAGSTGTVITSSKANSAANLGVALALTPTQKPLANGDFIVVRLNSIPGDPTAGWWPTTANGARFLPELADRKSGTQSLRIEAAAPNQTATLASYFDTLAGHSFVRLHGKYQLTFRAKPITPNAQIALKLERLDITHHTNITFLSTTRTLTPGWQNYTIPVTASDPPGAIGSVALTFNIASASILLDDVSLSFPSALGLGPRPSAMKLPRPSAICIPAYSATWTMAPASAARSTISSQTPLFASAAATAHSRLALKTSLSASPISSSSAKSPMPTHGLPSRRASRLKTPRTLSSTLALPSIPASPACAIGPNPGPLRSTPSISNSAMNSGTPALSPAAPSTNPRPMPSAPTPSSPPCAAQNISSQASSISSSAHGSPSPGGRSRSSPPTHTPTRSPSRRISSPPSTTRATKRPSSVPCSRSPSRSTPRPRA